MTRVNEESHTPNGDRKVECIECKIVFRTDHWLTKYCSRKCYKKRQNRLYYIRHENTVKRRMKKYMRNKRSN